jgi:hypothetical protein
MALFGFTKRLTLGMKIIYSIVAIGIIAAVVAGIVMYRNDINAKTMRIVRAEGTVRLEQSEGATKNVTKKTRFQSGDSVLTGIDGSAVVEMDDSKKATLQAESRAEFIKKNNQYEIRLTKGGLFFELSENLNEGETFEIKSNLITAGIKGTSGFISYDGDGGESLIVTDGNVIVTATNPDTGDKKYAEIHGGQKVTANVLSGKADDSVELIIEDVTEKDLPDFVLLTIADDNKLLDRVCESNGWSRNTILVLVDNMIKASANADNAAGTSDPSDESAAAATPTPKAAEQGTDTTAETTEALETSSNEDSGNSDRDNSATATPKPSVTNTPTPTKKPTSTPKPVVTATSTPKPTATPVPTATSTPTPTPEPTATSTPTPEPTEPEPTDPEPVLVAFDVTLEVVSLEEDGSETTDVITIEDVPADGDSPSISYLNESLKGYISYTILSSEPIYR